MTLQSLGKYLDKYDQQLSSAAAKQLELLKGLPFYNWPLLQKLPVTGSYQQEGQDIKTFNHAIGLPQKNGQPFPLFDYEQMLFDILQANKHIWIKKATGLGVTEFMLRYMAWLCFSDKNIGNSQMCIVTGSRIELAITLIDRMKAQFSTFNDRKIAKRTSDF